MRETVSACLIVLNEAERLPAALESVAFCDEVIVVDSGSTDGTVEIAREAGAHVAVNPWPGYGAQRNVAIERAAGEWILEIDADERVTPELRRSIETFLADPPAEFDMAAIPLRHRFLGRQLGPAGRYPLYRCRLFRRSAYRHDETRTVHEGLWSNGPVVVLDGDIEHILAGSLSEALHDVSRYAQLDAQQVGVPRTPLAAANALVARPIGKFGFRIFVHGGWRDGWKGLTKISLDLGADVLVGYHAVRSEQQAGQPEVPQIPRKGAVRLVGIAAADAGPDAAKWLSRAAGLGADVALITSAVVTPEPIRVLRLPRLGPVLVIRALDAENQLRPVDAVVTAGATAERLARFLPAHLKGIVDPLSVAVDAASAVARVEEQRRTG